MCFLLTRLSGRTTHGLSGCGRALNDFATSRAHSMKRAATGFIVRRFNVIIPTGLGGTGTLTGRTLTDRWLPAKCTKDPGSIVRYGPFATKAPCIGMPAHTTPRRGISKPLDPKISFAMRSAMLPAAGNTHGSLMRSASPILRRRVHRFRVPATITVGSLNRTSVSKSSSSNGINIRPRMRSTLRSRNSR